MRLTERQAKQIENEIDRIVREWALNHKHTEPLISYRDRGTGSVKHLQELLENREEEWDEIWETDSYNYARWLLGEELDRDIDEIVEETTGGEFDLSGYDSVNFLEDEIHPEIIIDVAREMENTVYDYNIQDLYDYNVLVRLKNPPECQIEESYCYSVSEEENMEMIEPCIRALERKYGVHINRDKALITFAQGGGIYPALFVVVNGAELYNAIFGGPAPQPENTMFGIFNFFSGSGDFMWLDDNARFSFDDIAEIDVGEYSVGGIFGTSDWVYR